MRNINLSSNSTPGAGSSVTAKEFFTNNNSNGVVDATVFLDHVEPMSQNSKLKYAYFWELLRNSNNILGAVVKRRDKNDLDYVWLDIELPRGKVPFKIILLSDAMFEFFVRYQRAEVSIRFNLHELISEAQRIENESSSNPTV